MDRREYQRQWRQRNPHKAAEYAARHRAKNPGIVKRERERKRVQRLKGGEEFLRRQREAEWRSRGISHPTRPEPDACESCGASPGRLHLDHDHATGKFRGWLCGKCNRGIGLLGDSVDGILNALTYFKRMVH